MSINISQDMFFYGGLIAFFYYRYKKVIKKENKDKVRELMIILYGIYLIKFMSLVFFPILLNLGENLVNLKPTIFLNPIKSISYIISTNNIFGIAYNICGNLILLFPLPIFLIYFYKDKIDTLLKVVLICLLVSIGIEYFQYIESILISGVGRFIETNDVILNTAGGMLGYLFYNRYLRSLLNK